MIRVGIIGNIGCGKTFVANKFGYPVFNADLEVEKIYKTIAFNQDEIEVAIGIIINPNF